MFLQYYVTDSTTRNRVNIEINAATKADLDATRNGWQTVWNTDFILDPQKEKYAAKTEDGEIIALGAYRVRKGSVAVYIAYIESQPESNPTLVEHKKYSGIGKAMIAFGIQLSIDASCNGVVVFEAKSNFASISSSRSMLRESLLIQNSLLLLFSSLFLGYPLLFCEGILN